MQTVAPRALAGIALMIVATAVGGIVMHQATQRSSVWAYDRSLAAGTVLRAGDLHITEVALDAVSAYLPANRPVLGRALAHDVGGGELVAASALVEAAPRAHLVTLAMEPLHLPLGLHRGDRVDVVATPVRDGVPGESAVLQRNVVVDAVATQDASGRAAVVLAVTQRDSVQLVAAVRGGLLDLVAIGTSA